MFHYINASTPNPPAQSLDRGLLGLGQDVDEDDTERESPSPTTANVLRESMESYSSEVLKVSRALSSLS